MKAENRTESWDTLGYSLPGADVYNGAAVLQHGDADSFNISVSGAKMTSCANVMMGR